MRIIEKFETQTTRGMLSKAWVELDNGLRCLIKGNSVNGKSIGYEPFSEVIASRIGKALGLPVVQYELIEKERCSNAVKLNGKVKYASICPSYKQMGVQYLSFSEYAISLGYSRTDPFLTYKLLGLDMNYLARLLALDAFIGNEDRHFGNFEVALSSNGVYNAPMFDFGASLLAWKDSSYCTKVKKGNRIYSDSSKPFKKTHTEQIRFIKRQIGSPSIFNILDKDCFYKYIFSQCDDVFSKMPDYRVNAIKNYLLNRSSYLE